MGPTRLSRKLPTVLCGTQVLIIGTAGGLIFSYMRSIPHYNFNVDVFVAEGVVDGMDAVWDAVGAIEPIPINGCPLDDVFLPEFVGNGSGSGSGG
jgi:hypothetical protein